MNVKQISVSLMNKPGALLEMTSALVDNGVNIRALTVANSDGSSTVRILVDNVIWASSALRDAGFCVSTTEVLAVEVPNVAGGIRSVLQVLNDGNVNIEYMYHVGGKRSEYGGNICIVFKFDDNELAAQVLNAAGIRLLAHGDLSAI